MRPKVDTRAVGPILDIKSLNFGSLEPIIHYFSSCLSYLYSTSWDLLNTCISDPKIPISVLKLNPVPKIIACDSF